MEESKLPGFVGRLLGRFPILEISNRGLSHRLCLLPVTAMNISSAKKPSTFLRQVFRLGNVASPLQEFVSALAVGF